MNTATTTDAVLLRRKFQMTEFGTNHNKFWLVEVFNNGTFKTTWGRVGVDNPQSKIKPGGESEAHRLISEKIAKGYREVDLVVPTVVAAQQPDVATVADPKLAQVVNLIFSEAGEYIKSYLSVGVDALSAAQIARGRTVLKEIMGLNAANEILGRKNNISRTLIGKVEEYYNAIPTKLPHRIKPEDVTADFLAHMDEQEDRLNQLEAAVATHATQTASVVSNVDALGAKLRWVSQSDNRYDEIVRLIDRTMVHGYRVKVHDVLEVEIPNERKAFDEETFGKSNVQRNMFHGTAGQNVRHILRSGLRLPTTTGHGKMFGYGIYFADVASKSTNYCSARGSRQFLFLVDVALGSIFQAPKASEDFHRAPDGYDSVQGVARYTKTWGTSTLINNEFIVYRPSQQTIRYLVTFERR